MNYWLVWPVGIGVWLALGWAAFGYFEAHALRPNAPPNEISLSYFVYTVGSKFPLSILLGGLIIGCLTGALGVHFFWHWCPPGSVSSGMLGVPGVPVVGVQDRIQYPPLCDNGKPCPYSEN